MKRRGLLTLTIVASLGVLVVEAPRLLAQGDAPAGRAANPGPGRAMTPAPDPAKPAKLEITAGSTARYRVREQLAGISFPSDAVGTTEAVTGTIVVNPDGTLDAARSKITVDLTTLKSDQDMRDGYVRDRTLETEQYPTLTFVAKRAVGLPSPLPSGMQAQAGFQLIGDMTLHGVTKEVTWNVVSTFGNDRVQGHAETTFPFALFGLAKPSLARLLSVNDDITLEIEFKCDRTAL
jgi:polyisoprenoid-binding protein YceI